MSGFSIGAGISPINLLPGLQDQPTGPALVSLIKSEGIRIVRLVAETPNPQPVVYQEMHASGWRDIFSELSAAHIDAVLLIGGDAGVNGVDSGTWPPEPVSLAPTPSQSVESTSQWIANQGAILADIKAQCGGVPRSLVGIEAANEPLVTQQTIPMLRQDIEALHREVPGLPVTLAGWRTPAIQAGEQWNYNDPADTYLVAPLVDYVTTHMYLDGLPTLPTSKADRYSSDASEYVDTAESFLNQVIAMSERKPVFVGEFGGIDGKPPSSPTDPRGGTPGHQAAIIEASSEAMFADRSRGVTGGTIWLLEQNEGKGYPCSSFDLVCFGEPPMTLGLQALAAAAKEKS